MPEIAEVARVVHFLRKNIVGRTLSNVLVQDDQIVYGKVGTSAAEFQKAMIGKKILDAGQQGKYFWLEMNTPPHAVLHLGMTGWVHFKDEPQSHYRAVPESKDGKASWPPPYWKFILETTSGAQEGSSSAAAFVDARRLARIRLIDCPASNIRKVPPLSLNGPDPVIDSNILTEPWLAERLALKRVPLKAWLLDQSNLSGVGNWVGDEVLYHAKIHPETYTNALSASQVKALHENLLYVTRTAVDAKADSKLFPQHWLMLHRWGKGKKGQPNKLPNGETISFLTVGGRTSAFVATVQKKTDNGNVPETTVVTQNGLKGKKRSAAASEGSENINEQPKKVVKNIKRKVTKTTKKVNGASDIETVEIIEEIKTVEKAASDVNSKSQVNETKSAKKAKHNNPLKTAEGVRRRSARLSEN